MVKVSVLMPAYNEQHFVSAAISSILAQTFEDWELIIVNDGSTDYTMEILEKFEKLDKRIKVFSKENGGCASALNFGLKKCNGKYVSQLDADDIALPTKLQFLNDFLEKNKDFAVVYSDGFILNKGNFIERKCPRFSRYAIFAENFIQLPGTMTRKEDLIMSGGYDEQLATGEDWDMWRRLAFKGCKFGHLAEKTFVYRLHGGNLSYFHPQREKMQEIIKSKHKETIPIKVSKKIIGLKNFSKKLHYSISLALEKRLLKKNR